MDKVLNNRDLLLYIMEYVPLTIQEKDNRINLINELKLKNCEWSYSIPRCYVCCYYHPCVIYRSRGLCNNCKSHFQIIN